MQIICVGDLCCDLIVPYGKMRMALANGNISKELAETLQVSMQCGGSVGNVARHLGRMDANPIFVTPLRRDSLGEYLVSEMEKMGVDMKWAAPSDKSNMYCVGVLDEGGERTMFCFVPPWADYPKFKKDSFKHVPGLPGQILFTSGMAILDDHENNSAVLSFFEERRAAGAKIVFDLNVRAESYGYEGERKRAMEKMISTCDVLLGSGAEEFGQVTGTDDIRKAAGYLRELGAETVIARDGGGPILILGPGLDEYIPVKPVTPVSTLGAGDSFDAKFLEQIAAGEELRMAVRKASYYAGAYISGKLRVSGK